MGETGKPPSSPKLPALYTAGEVADYLGVDEETVYAVVQRGELKAFKVAGRLRFKGEDLEAYLQGCAMKPGGRLVDEERRAKHPGRPPKGGPELTGPSPSSERRGLSECGKSRFFSKKRGRERNIKPEMKEGALDISELDSALRSLEPPPPPGKSS